MHCQTPINTHIPSKNVTISKRDPPFMTPKIKLLLRERNKFIMQKRKKSDKICKLITKHRSKINYGLLIK